MAEKSGWSKTSLLQIIVIPLFIAFLAKPMEEIWVYLKNIKVSESMYKISNSFYEMNFSEKILLLDAVISLFSVFLFIIYRYFTIKNDSFVELNFIQKFVLIRGSFIPAICFSNIVSLSAFMIYSQIYAFKDFLKIWMNGRQMFLSIILLFVLWKAFERVFVFEKENAAALVRSWRRLE